MKHGRRTWSQRIAPLGVWFAALLAGLACSAGCHSDLYDQPRYDTFEPSEFFADGQSARPLIAGTIARGALEQDEAFTTGKSEGQFVAEVPLELDRSVLERGEQRFTIFCTPCHARTGTGDGMIVQRGFRRPPSFHSERLREAPAGHYFDVMTHGFGAMPSYAVQLDAQDRWAIVAYIRVLQLSQHAALDDLPPDERARLEQPSPPSATDEGAQP